MKTRYSVWYKRGRKWHCLADNLSLSVAFTSVDSLRKANMQAFVVVGR